MKFFVSALALLGVSAASAFPDQDPYSAPSYPAPAPKPYAAPPKGYPAPVPKSYAPRVAYKEEVVYDPQPYQFQYGVSAAEEGTNFKVLETQDAAGNVNGGYEVQLPDGRLQIVKYVADGKNGFVAEVSYSGEPVYPPPPPGGYPGENGKRYEGPSYQAKRPAYKNPTPVYEN